MSNSIFQSVIGQLREATDRVLGVIDTDGNVVSCTDPVLLGERWSEAALKVGGADGLVAVDGKDKSPSVAYQRLLFLFPYLKNAIRYFDLSMIAPATDRMWQDRASAFRADETVTALSAPDAPDAYFAAFEDQDGKKGLVYFEATQKSLRICHFYNASATTLTKVSK